MLGSYITNISSFSFLAPTSVLFVTTVIASAYALHLCAWAACKGQGVEGRLFWYGNLVCAETELRKLVRNDLRQWTGKSDVNNGNNKQRAFNQIESKGILSLDENSAIFTTRLTLRAFVAEATSSKANIFSMVSTSLSPPTTKLFCTPRIHAKWLTITLEMMQNPLEIMLYES